MTDIRRIGQCLAFALFLVAVARGQESTSTDTTVADALHRMSDLAGVVFVGEVVAIRHIAAEGDSSGVVEVEFRVDQAMRGCAVGSYVLREWAGLWSGSDQRYRIGQRLLMLLHSPGVAGVTSPVGGMAGVIPIRGSVSELTASAAPSTAGPLVADLRWVGTRLQRSMVYRSSSLLTANAASMSRVIGADSSGGEASTAAQQAPIGVVVDMLTVWQKRDAK